jgi:hypothetical protein
MKFSESIVREAIKLCSEFECGKCPYKVYDSSDYMLRCIHNLMMDINELVNGKERVG